MWECEGVGCEGVGVGVRGRGIHHVPCGLKDSCWGHDAWEHVDASCRYKKC